MKTSLMVKLGSIIVHFEEYYSANGHPYDLQSAKVLLNDPEVKAWFDEMNGQAMLPMKR